MLPTFLFCHIGALDGKEDRREKEGRQKEKEEEIKGKIESVIISIIL